jgi:hypothetical protein
MVIFVVALQFWRLRGIAESTVKYARMYCKKEGLQYISLARVNTHFRIHRGKPDWLLDYQLEFSSDGETQYNGIIQTHGRDIVKVELPVFRMVDSDRLH